MNVLFWLEPSADYQAPGRYNWWGKQFLDLDSRLRRAGTKYNSVLVSFESFDPSIENYQGRWIKIDYQDIYKSQSAPGEIDLAFRAEEAGAGLVEKVLERLGDFSPDVVLWVGDFPALRRRLPQAVFLTVELSWFSRYQFPEYYQIDPFGYGKGRFAAENLELFKGRAPGDDERKLLGRFRRKAFSAVSGQGAEEYVSALRREFPHKRLVLLPTGERYVLDGRTPIAVGLDSILRLAPKEDLYVVTVHPGDNCLNLSEIEWLEKKHLNLKICKNSNLKTAVLLPRMDAVVGDFTSASLYGLIYNVPVVSVRDRLPGFDAGFLNRNPLGVHLVGLTQDEVDSLLLALLLNSTITPGRFYDGAWLSQYLERAVECKRRGNMRAIFDEPLVSVAGWLDDPWLDVNGLETWLAARQLTSAQLRLTQEYIADRKEAALLVLILAASMDEAGLRRTLDGLLGCDAALNIDYVILAEEELKTTDAKVRFARAGAAEYADRLNELIRESHADWFMVISAGETFTENGMHLLGVELVGQVNCQAIYADELIRSDGELGAMFRPDFNLDMLLSMPCSLSRHWLFRREAFLGLGGYDSDYAEAFELDLILRLIEERGVGSVAHLPEPLLVGEASKLITVPDEVRALEAHLWRRGYSDGRVEVTLPGRYRISYGHSSKPLVSIIIPTKDQLPMLIRCVTSLLEKTSYSNFELLIVDNNSETREAKEWLSGVAQLDPKKIRVLRYPHPFNYSAINNMAAREARGEYLVLLNNDTAVLHEDWLEALLNHGQRPEVGIVGAKLLYPTGNIQHAGVILGLRGPADHPFMDEKPDAPGYMHRMQVDQNLGVVTAACLLIRKSVYEEVGGLDQEAFKVSYNDVDLCLKVRQVGYFTVWTPHSVLLHEGSVSQNTVDPAKAEEKQKRFMAEQDAMYEKWLPLIARDPAYNPNLSLIGNGFEIEDSSLTWKPLSWRPLPVVLAHMADKTGCGQYRVIQPFNAAKEAGLIDGALSGRLLTIPEQERFNPDSIVFQRQLLGPQLELMGRSRKFSRAFKVFELDDYLPNLPLKSAHRATMPKDIVKSLRRALGYVDRFVVSTEPLAEALSGLHGEIQVVKNRLDPRWWKDVSGKRRVSNKPRVGWAGGASHTGDLEMIADVVKELASEVEWVFFGMCPDKLRPYIHEFRAGVDIEQYPAALAHLNLDLALAPVEANLFNECKSNLRVLEYGACGFPVICTDLVCYQGDLPVTRVRNRFKDWTDAIRMHIADLDTTARMGDELRAAVHRGWMLEGANLELWRKAWLPD